VLSGFVIADRSRPGIDRPLTREVPWDDLADDAYGLVARVRKLVLGRLRERHYSAIGFMMTP
jgi:hypothetical protein